MDAATAYPYYLYYYNQDKLNNQLKIWTLEDEKKKYIEEINNMPKGASLKKHVQQLNMINKLLVKMRTRIVPSPPHGKYCMECEILYDDADSVQKYGFCYEKCATYFNGELSDMATEFLD